MSVLSIMRLKARMYAVCEQEKIPGFSSWYLSENLSMILKRHPNTKVETKMSAQVCELRRTDGVDTTQEGKVTQRPKYSSFETTDGAQ